MDYEQPEEISDGEMKDVDEPADEDDNYSIDINADQTSGTAWEDTETTKNSTEGLTLSRAQRRELERKAKKKAKASRVKDTPALAPESSKIQKVKKPWRHREATGSSTPAADESSTITVPPAPILPPSKPKPTAPL